MMLPLLLSLVVSATDDPPVKVWLNHDNYFQRGDKARVNVKLADDGYLLVLRADAEGRVRVLFPLDPSNDNFVRGHETIEVRGRGDREAFFVDDREGSGLVLAARSTAPFKLDEFVLGYGWGLPYRYRYGALYSTCYDPFFYDPFLCYDPIFYRPYGYGFFGYSFGYGYGYRSYFGGGYAFHNRSRNLFINRVRTGTSFQMPFRDRSGTNTSVGGVGPRFRVPDGALATRRRPDTTPVRERDAMRRDGGDRVAFPARDRGDPATPTAREPERRVGGGGGGGEGRVRRRSPPAVCDG